MGICFCEAIKSQFTELRGNSAIPCSLHPKVDLKASELARNNITKSAYIERFDELENRKQAIAQCGAQCQMTWNKEDRYPEQWVSTHMSGQYQSPVGSTTPLILTASWLSKALAEAMKELWVV